MILSKAEKLRILEAKNIEIDVRMIDEGSPVIGLRIPGKKNGTTIVVLTPEEASKLVNKLLGDEVKVLLNVPDERKDVMYA